MNAARVHGPAERGFVLIGVVIIVLALTILGLSLFSLSSYEAQFLGQRLGQAQALYGAQSGAEIVKVVLSTTPFRLSDAHLAEGRMGIVRAVAKQWKTTPVPRWDSTGTVDPDPSRPVWVTIVSDQGGSRRTIEAKYTPGRRKEYYKRLFTTPGTIDVAVMSDNGPPDRRGTTWLEGDILETTPGARLYMGPDVHWSSPPYQALTDTVHAPFVSGVGGYIDTHSSGASVIPMPVSTPDTTITLGGPGATAATPAYYVGPGLPKAWYVAATGGPDPLELRVRGTAVWMLPYGFRADRRVKIERSGGGDATLIMVAGPNQGTLDQVPGVYDPEIGLWFFSQIECDHHVNLILVSDGWVWIEHAGLTGGQSFVEKLAIFAGDGAHSIRTLGPTPGSGNELRLSFDSSMEGVVDALLTNNVLPLPSLGQTRAPFALVPGSWRELTP